MNLTKSAQQSVARPSQLILVLSGRSKAGLLGHAAVVLATFLIGALAALTFAGCAAALTEPPLDQQLWRRNDCFAHMMPDWRVLTLPALAGVAHNASDPEDPLPGVIVYARQWNAETMKHTTTDAEGRSELTVPPGDYEVALCAAGWNPWRGAVRVTGGRPHGVARFPLQIGQ